MDDPHASGFDNPVPDPSMMSCVWSFAPFHAAFGYTDVRSRAEVEPTPFDNDPARGTRGVYFTFHAY